MYSYISSQPALWTVGLHAADGSWVAESDHDSSDSAADRVAYLNGMDPERRSLAAEIRRLSDLAMSLEDHIVARAKEVADPLIEDAEDRCRHRVAQLDRDLEYKDGLVAELRRHVSVLEQRLQRHTTQAVSGAQMWLVWSHDVGAWWGPDMSGYRQDDRLAGRYAEQAARECCERRTWQSGRPVPPEVMVLAPEYWDQADLASLDVVALLRGRVQEATRAAIAARMPTAAEIG
jgi:hypothetical protein